MHFVRVAFAEEAEIEVQSALAEFEVLGVDEGNLADGRREYLIYFPSRDAATACRAVLSGYEASVEEEADRNWNAEWQSGWEPVAVGKRWWLTPPGWTGETPSGRIRLDYHPGTAFGNGDHATTQLCLEWLEELVRPGDRVLDVGCGSGLLCLAAQALGARAYGCDLDIFAVAAAQAYGVQAFRGSVEAAGPVEIVVANIQAAILRELLPDLRRVAGRELVLSGVLTEQADEFAGMRKERSGWVAVRMA